MPTMRKKNTGTKSRAVRKAKYVAAPRCNETLQKIHTRFDAIDERFNKIDERFVIIDEQFDGVYRKFDEIERRLERLEGNIFTKEDQRKMMERLDWLVNAFTRQEQENLMTEQWLKRLDKGVEGHSKWITAREKIHEKQKPNN